MRRSYDTIYSRNVSQAVIVSWVQYDVGASSLTNVYISIKKVPLGMHQNYFFKYKSKQQQQ